MNGLTARTRINLHLLCALTLLGLALRVIWLGRQSLWYDEAFSWAVARADWSVFWPALLSDGVHPPGYYLLLRACLALFGEGEFALRFPSAVAGVMAVPLMARLGRLLGGARWGLAAAALVAVNPFAIWYAQEVRMYSLLLCLTAAVGYAFWRLVQQPGWRSWLWLTAITACAFLVHYFALVLSVAQFVYLASDLGRTRRALRWWVLAQVAACVPFLPWALAIAAREGRNFGIGWIRHVALVDLPLTLTNLSFGLSDPATPWTWVALVVVVAAIVGGMLCAARGEAQAAGFEIRREQVARIKRPATGVRNFLLTWLAVPMAFTWLLSLRMPLYVDRFLIICLPALLLLISTIGFSRGRLTRGIMVALVAISTATSLRLWFDPALAKEDWRAAAAYVEAREGPADALVMRDFQTGIPFGYYYHGALPRQVATLNQQLTLLENVAVGHERLWLVYRRPFEPTHQLAGSQPFTWDAESEPLFKAWLLGNRARLADERTFPGVYITLYQLEPAASP